MSNGGVIALTVTGIAGGGCPFWSRPSKPGRSETGGRDTDKGVGVPVSCERSMEMLSETKHTFAISKSCESECNMCGVVGTGGL